jgi:hypothetical protein
MENFGKIKSFESSESKEDYSSKIELKFFRHDEKEKNPLKSESELELTESGKMHAKNLAEDSDIRQSVSFGSFVKRTQETAALVMAGNIEEIDGTESFDELRSKIDKDIMYGSKVNIDRNLAINLDESPFGKAWINAYTEGRLLTFLTEESDDLAKELGDESGGNYSHVASMTASIIKKYIQVSSRFDNLVHEKPDDYTPLMKRFFGTHNGIIECFPAKLIELTKGKEELRKFIDAVGDKGFDYAEGFDVEIIKKDSTSDPMVRVSYRKIGENPEEDFKFDETIPLSLIEKIIQEK